jgi:aerobic carbon-monoxide dehydrogenase large subunit
MSETAADLTVAGVEHGHGARVRRVEDPRLLRGEAPYTDDLKPAGALQAVFVRSDWAHARIRSIDTSEAASAAGVVGVFTAADLGLGNMAHGNVPEQMARPVLATDRVRFAGEPVAVIVAESRALGVDASELVLVDYDPLDVVVDPEGALGDGAPRLFDGAGNLALEGGEGAEEDVLADADVVVRARFVNQRVAAVPMEPNAALAAPDPETGGVTLWAQAQAQFSIRDAVAAALGLDESKVRVVTTWLGGGFGARIATYPEQVVIAKLALQLGRPVRYVEGRSDTMTAMQHGRAQLQDVELGARRDGTLTGLRVRVIADCGAYPADAIEMPWLTGLMLAGVYRMPKIDYRYRCAVTNTTPIGAYRGAGRPEAAALVERAMDMLAAELGVDPIEVRRRNFIAPEEFPIKTQGGASYDSGEYARALDKVLEVAGYEQLRAEQRERRERGDAVQLGIGISTYVEFTGFGGEKGTCAVSDDGRVTVTTGTSPHGQGHETAWAQLVSGTLGVRLEDVTVVHSDTAKVPPGLGTMGSRSLQVGGSAVLGATRVVLEQARRLAAHLLEADAADIAVFPGAGLGVAGAPGRTLSWGELAQAAADPARRPADWDGDGLNGEDDFETPDATYPFGAHLAVVEVDTETGLARLQRIVTVDDAGRIANPLLAEGQIHGGIAQGVAQALYEEIAFDEDGNCVTGTLTSYAIISARELPFFETQRTVTPSPRNPLGAKGIGESGAIGSTPAVWNAVVDALSPFGVRNIDMPATPQRVWEALAAARGG